MSRDEHDATPLPSGFSRDQYAAFRTAKHHLDAAAQVRLMMTAAADEVALHRAKKEREDRLRQHNAGASAHERGEAFALRAYAYDDDAFGTIDTGEVIMLLDPEELTGIRMSKDHALRVAAALIQSVLAPSEEE